MNCFKAAILTNTLKLNAVSANKLSTSKQLLFLFTQSKLNNNEKSEIRLPFAETNETLQNAKAENISRAMSYYLEKLAERGSIRK